MNTASLIADLHNVRCGQCKVLVRDIGADQCESCGAQFDRVVSNHVGVAKKVQALREAAKNAKAQPQH
jgi:rRNA maturation endonuclease Nob1